MIILFTHPEQFRSLFSLILWSPSSHNYSFQLSTLVLQIIPVHHSSILLSARDLFVLMYINSLKHLRSFAKFFPVFLYLFFVHFNSYGGSFKISLPFLSYQFYSLFQPFRWFVQYLPKSDVISLLIFSTRISNMPNPLIVINLNW